MSDAPHIALEMLSNECHVGCSSLVKFGARQTLATSKGLGAEKIALGPRAESTLGTWVEWNILVSPTTFLYA
jgi:hypothetical protein